MGFIKAFAGALGGTFADQWKDFYGPRDGIPSTAAFFPAVAKGTNSGRGENYKGSENIITNGSKIIVPEGTALITVQDGQITGMIAEPGGFIFNSDDPNSKSMFSGDGFLASTVKEAWERFKFGGQPGSQQLAFYVNLKEIPNNRFGTQSEIYWDDAFLNTQVGVITRGSYTIKIVDPILFVKNVLPVDYLGPNGRIFDFANIDDNINTQLFNEVVDCLSSAFSIYTNDPSRGNRITSIQSDKSGMASALGQAVEQSYQWKSNRGLEISSVAITSIEYDEDTKELLKDVKKADALSGNRGNSFMQQSVARGIQNMSENNGATGLAFMNMGMNATGSMMQGVTQQPSNATNPFINTQNQNFAQNNGMQNVGQMQNMQQSMPQNQNVQPNSGIQTNGTVNNNVSEDPYEKLSNLKKLLDNGVITQADFDEVKKKLLGL